MKLNEHCRDTLDLSIGLAMLALIFWIGVQV